MLEGAADGLEISRNDIDGVVHSGADGRSGLVLFDTVPGGAGSVLRIAAALDVVIATAVRRVGSCDCGLETLVLRLPAHPAEPSGTTRISAAAPR